MAMSKQFIKDLPEMAWKYIEECQENKVEMATNKGIQEVRSRHIPTIGYFLRFWLPKNYMDTIHRGTWYKWLAQKDADGNPNEKSDTIKVIDDLFKEFATDIVANEGKGIFYAKNRLGMTDRQQVDTTANVKILSFDPLED